MYQLVGELPIRGALPAAHMGEKSITSPWDRLYVARTRAAVAQNGPQAIDQDIEAVLQVRLTVGPQVMLNLLAGNQLIRTLDQQAEKIKRLAGEFDRPASSTEPPQAFVQFELSKLLEHGVGLVASRLYRRMRSSEVI